MMKRRSRTEIETRVEKAKAQVNPATAAITIRNNELAPFFRRLPQETRDSIYEYVLESHQILYVGDSGRTADDRAQLFNMQPCKARMTYSEIRLRFVVAARWSFSHWERADRYDSPWLTPLPALGNGHPPARYGSGLFLACHSTCYEGTLNFFRTNTLFFRSPQLLWKFINGTHHAPITAIRRIQLDIGVRNEQDEYVWNKALGLMAKKFTGLREISVCVYQQSRYDDFWKIHPDYTNPATEGGRFLNNIYKLRRRSMKEVSVLIADGLAPDGLRQVSTRARRQGESRWTPAQKQEWATHVKAVILGSN